MATNGLFTNPINDFDNSPEFPYGMQFFPGRTDYGTKPTDVEGPPPTIPVTGLAEFLAIIRNYVEGLDQDDPDRIYRQEEANKWIDLLKRYESGDANFEELKSFESEFLSEIPEWGEYYNNFINSTTEQSWINEFGEAFVNKIPQGLKDFIKGVANDPLGALKNIIDSINPDLMDQFKRGKIGVEVIFGDWKNSKVFGPIAIPGVPLPPGILEVTIEDIENAVKEVGGTIGDFVKGMKNDPEKTIGDLITKIKNKVKGVFDGAVDDPGWGGSIGGFEDWVRGIFGAGLGGIIFNGIYDTVKGWFPPVGGKSDDNDGDEEKLPAGTPEKSDSADTGDAGSFESYGYEDIYSGRADLIGGPTGLESTADDYSFGSFGYQDQYSNRGDLIGGGGSGADSTNSSSLIGGKLDDPTTTTTVGGSTSSSSGGGGGGGGFGGAEASPFLATFPYNPQIITPINIGPRTDFAQGALEGMITGLLAKRKV